MRRSLRYGSSWSGQEALWSDRGIGRQARRGPWTPGTAAAFTLYWHTRHAPDPDAVIPGGSSGAFSRLPREHARLDGLDLYARVLAGTGVPIRNPQRIDEAASKFRDNLVDVTNATSTLHGWRAQALFEATVASLGKVRLLKLEDSGDVFFDGDPLKFPRWPVSTNTPLTPPGASGATADQRGLRARSGQRCSRRSLAPSARG